MWREWRAGEGEAAGAGGVGGGFVAGAAIDEETVTGSGLCALTHYWTARFGRDHFAAYQAGARGGYVGCKLVGDKVELTGRCVTTLVGEFLL